MWGCWVLCFQAEDGIRDLVRSRGLGDVYKRQVHCPVLGQKEFGIDEAGRFAVGECGEDTDLAGVDLSLIHI